jgi:hypothetical protein
MNWPMIAVAVSAPAALAGLVVFPFWRRGQVIVGNAIAAGVIFLAAVVFAGGEFTNVERQRLACEAANIVCSNHPSPFMRMAVFGVISFVQVAALFAVSLVVEERIRRRDFDGEWRR